MSGNNDLAAVAHPPRVQRMWTHYEDKVISGNVEMELRQYLEQHCKSNSAAQNTKQFHSTSAMDFT